MNRFGLMLLPLLLATAHARPLVDGPVPLTLPEGFRMGAATFVDRDPDAEGTQVLAWVYLYAQPNTAERLELHTSDARIHGKPHEQVLATTSDTLMVDVVERCGTAVVWGFSWAGAPTVWTYTPARTPRGGFQQAPILSAPSPDGYADAPELGDACRLARR